MKYGSDKKMKDDMNPKRMKKVYGGSGGSSRTGYMKGGSAQPNYKSGELHKCMPN